MLFQKKNPKKCFNDFTVLIFIQAYLIKAKNIWSLAIQ